MVTIFDDAEKPTNQWPSSKVIETYFENPVTTRYLLSITHETLAPFFGTISPPSTIGLQSPDFLGSKIRIFPSRQMVATKRPHRLHSALNN